MALNTKAKIGADGALAFLGHTNLSTAITTSDLAVASNWTVFAEVNTINLDPTQGEANVTSLNSGTVEEYVPGHLSCTATFNANLIEHTSANDANVVIDLWQARANRAYMVKIPVAPTSGTSSGYLYTGFIGFPTGIPISITDGDEAMSIDLNLRVADSTLVDTFSTTSVT